MLVIFYPSHITVQNDLYNLDCSAYPCKVTISINTNNFQNPIVFVREKFVVGIDFEFYSIEFTILISLIDT